MKAILPLLSLAMLTIIWGCTQKNQDNGEHSHHHEAPEGGNQALYDDVMKVQDEVMPKMNDIYKLKEALKKQIADSPNLVDEKKKAIESTILKLDSASEGMMVWMRNFNPIADSLGEQQAREYLEDQQEKVKKV